MRKGTEIRVWLHKVILVEGTDNFAGAGSYTTITHNLGHTNYEVLIRPNADTGGYEGDVWEDNLAANTFQVHNKGSGTTGFAWQVIAK